MLLTGVTSDATRSAAGSHKFSVQHGNLQRQNVWHEDIHLEKCPQPGARERNAGDIARQPMVTSCSRQETEPIKVLSPSTNSKRRNGNLYGQVERGRSSLSNFFLCALVSAESWTGEWIARIVSGSHKRARQGELNEKEKKEDKQACSVIFSGFL